MRFNTLLHCNKTQNHKAAATPHLHHMQRLMPRAVPLAVHTLQDHAGSTICAARIVLLHGLSLRQRNDAGASMNNVQCYVCAEANASFIAA
jgi:hypothetical protein